MPSVAEALRQHGPVYLETFGERMPREQHKVLSAIQRCRTGELGGILYQCDGCGRTHWVGRSCGNRHCPTCQHEKTAVWLQKQTARLLPVHYFLVTFTVPEALRRTLRAQQRAGYQAIFDAGSGTIRELATNPRFIGTSQIGFFGVLQTWGRDLATYHPHVHFVVPGGGVSEDGTRWLSSPTNFLFPESAASKIYRAKFRDAMKAAGLFDSIPPDVWRQHWQVDVLPVGNGRAALKYLAPYVFRVAISDNRIESCTETHVTYRYTPTGAKCSVTKTVTGEAFTRNFLQHVLPRGFQKVRHYGFLSPHAKIDFESVRMLVCFFLGWVYWLASGPVPPVPPPERPGRPCPKCGGALQIISVVHADCRTLLEHSTKYFDSG
jgi:hypothetical protein